jgi:hypothetical protein
MCANTQTAIASWGRQSNEQVMGVFLMKPMGAHQESPGRRWWVMRTLVPRLSKEEIGDSF